MSEQPPPRPSLVDQGLAELRRMLGIRSPSEVYRQQAADFSARMIEGIERAQARHGELDRAMKASRRNVIRQRMRRAGRGRL